MFPAMWAGFSLSGRLDHGPAAFQQFDFFAK
jgi:hypothetical protein